MLLSRLLPGSMVNKTAFWDVNYNAALHFTNPGCRLLHCTETGNHRALFLPYLVRI
jgi:hypothetical protein